MSERDRPTLEHLEREVPDAWVEGMWPRVRSGIDASGRRAPVRRWILPTLAAASLALLLSTAVALRAARAAAERESTLAAQLVEQERKIAELERATREGSTVTSPAQSAWLRSLRSRDDLTLRELRDLLRELPAETVIVRRARAHSVSRTPLLPNAWRRAFAGLEEADVITAADLVGVLDALGLSEATTVSASRLFDLLT